MPEKRRAPDDGLRALLRAHLLQLQWTTVETWAVQSGVPDSEFAYRGAQGWVESKATRAWAVTFRPYQVGWLLRRVREGGRCFVAVRRRPGGASAVDELWLFDGADAPALDSEGLRGSAKALLVTLGGPGGWAWEDVLAVLTRRRDPA